MRPRIGSEAVVAIILAVYAVFTGILVASGSKHPENIPPLLDPMRLAIVAAITGTVILLGSLFKVFTLREGGAPVARSLGGGRLRHRAAGRHGELELALRDVRARHLPLQAPSNLALPAAHSKATAELGHGVGFATGAT